MHFLALTFDAAGNLPPLLGLAEALLRRRHRVEIMGHESQRRAILDSGADFLSFATAPERDGAAPNEPATPAWRDRFDAAACADFLAAAAARRPDILVVDAMLPVALAAANASSWPAAALVHAPFRLLLDYLDGRFRGPLEAADLMLVTSHAAFDPDPAIPGNVVHAGPLRPWRMAEWVRREPTRKLVLASLSTGRQSEAELLHRLCEALAGVDAEVLVTSGPAFAPEKLPAGPNMTIVGTVPHEAVLPFADLLVTHGAHDTVMAGLEAGVPMLCLPGLGEQPVNAARVAALGLGLTLPNETTAEVLRRAVERLLADRDLRRRSRDFADRITTGAALEPALDRLEALAGRVCATA